MHLTSTLFSFYIWFLDINAKRKAFSSYFFSSLFIFDTPFLIQVNASQYENGWIIKVEMSDTGELNSLDSEQYTKFCEEEDAKHWVRYSRHLMETRKRIFMDKWSFLKGSQRVGFFLLGIFVHCAFNCALLLCLSLQAMNSGDLNRIFLSRLRIIVHVVIWSPIGILTIFELRISSFCWSRIPLWEVFNFLLSMWVTLSSVGH